jgi:hypothetical protein
MVAIMQHARLRANQARVAASAIEIGRAIAVAGVVNPCNKSKQTEGLQRIRAASATLHPLLALETSV